MKNNKLNKHFKKAFTLVELIIVIAVIAILAVFMIPNFSNVLGDAGVTNVKSDASNIKNIVMAYINESGAVPVINLKDDAGVSGGLGRITITSGTKKIQPGISLSAFQNSAVNGSLYVIDMDLLTKEQINIEDKISVVKPKLPSIPGTSALVDVTTKENGGTTGNIQTNKTVKNTSVVYAIDKDLNVYAVYNKAMKKGIPTLPTTGSWEVLSPSTTLAEVLGAAKPVVDNHKTFKQPYIAGVTVVNGLSVDDSNYNGL